MQSTEDDTHDTDQPPRCPSARSPRQFGLAELMGVTTLLGMLFGCLAALDAHPMVSWSTVVLLAMVGTGRVFLFGGKSPLRASALLGSILFVLLSIALVITRHMGVAISESESLPLLIFVALSPALGAVLGLASGGLLERTLSLARQIGEWPATRRRRQCDRAEQSSPDFSTRDPDSDR